jgi:hypothetical protein
MTAGSPARWKTIAGDSLGLVAAVWSIPIAIVLVGLPIALLFKALQMAARSIWP